MNQLDEGVMLSSGIKAMIMLLIPHARQFHADSINIESLTVHNHRHPTYNVPSLTNEKIYQLALNDIGPDNALLISTKDRYNSYINWLIRNKDPNDLNMRLSMKKGILKFVCPREFKLRQLTF